MSYRKTKIEAVKSAHMKVHDQQLLTRLNNEWRTADDKRRKADDLLSKLNVRIAANQRIFQNAGDYKVKLYNEMVDLKKEAERTEHAGMRANLLEQAAAKKQTLDMWDEKQSSALRMIETDKKRAYTIQDERDRWAKEASGLQTQMGKILSEED